MCKQACGDFGAEKMGSRRCSSRKELINKRLEDHCGYSFTDRNWPRAGLARTTTHQSLHRARTRFLKTQRFDFRNSNFTPRHTQGDACERQHLSRSEFSVEGKTPGPHHIGRLELLDSEAAYLRVNCLLFSQETKIEYTDGRETRAPSASCATKRLKKRCTAKIPTLTNENSRTLKPRTDGLGLGLG